MKLTEKDLSRIIDNVLNEITWRTTNQMNLAYKDDIHALEMIRYKINSILDTVYNDKDDSNYGHEYVNINKINQPIKNEVIKFINYLTSFKNYIDKKISQFKQFEQYSDNDFKKEFNMSMSDYENSYADKEDSLFNRHLDKKIDDDEYDRQYNALQPERDVIDKINGI